MSGTDPKIPPVIIPQLQFVDANGHPYAGGSLLTLVPNTSTLKTTWQDPQKQAANTNPIILDAAGRCLVWGDGDYQLVLSDAQGNQVSSFLATSLVSAAMYPVVTAPDIPTALAVLGITGMLDAETEARGAAITQEAETRKTFDEALAAEIEYIWDVDNTNTPPGGAAQQADAVLQANIDAERLRAEDAEAAMAFGVGGTDRDRRLVPDRRRQPDAVGQRHHLVWLLQRRISATVHNVPVGGGDGSRHDGYCSWRSGASAGSARDHHRLRRRHPELYRH